MFQNIASGINYWISNKGCNLTAQNTELVDWVREQESGIINIKTDKMGGIIFRISPQRHYVVGINEVILMNTHNVYFYGEAKKLIL